MKSQAGRAAAQNVEGSLYLGFLHKSLGSDECVLAGRVKSDAGADSLSADTILHINRIFVLPLSSSSSLLFQLLYKRESTFIIKKALQYTGVKINFCCDSLYMSSLGE